jgi:hypothetical protein
MSVVPSEIRILGAEAVATFERLSSEYGEKWAAMVVLQQPPGLRGTDRTLMERRYNGEWLNDMAPDMASRIVREAKAAGISISGKYYCSSLADGRAHRDPAAWIDSAADIKKVAAERNLNVTGAVTHKRVELPPTPSVPIGAQAMKRLSAIERKRHPGKKAGEIRELVIDKYAPTWKRTSK